MSPDDRPAYLLTHMQPQMEALGNMNAEAMFGSPWHEEYMRIAPNPEDFATLFRKKSAMNRNLKDVPDEAIRAIRSPILIVLGIPALFVPNTP